MLRSINHINIRRYFRYNKSGIRVIDGATVIVRGQSADVRLVGFNTPETRSPACSAELEAGQRASARLSYLMGGAGSIEFRRMACAGPVDVFCIKEITQAANVSYLEIRPKIDEGVKLLQHVTL